MHLSHGKFSKQGLLLCAFLLCVAVACLTRMGPAVAALALGLGLCFFGKPDLQITLKRLFVANLFLLLLWLTTPWTTPGDTIWQAGPLHITTQGVALCALVTVKANAVLVIFFAMTAGIGVVGLGNALLKLHCPNKLVLLFLLMGRNVAVIRLQWHKLETAAKLRGFKLQASLRAYKTFAVMLATLIIRASERAQVCHEAMLLRGFNGFLHAGPGDAWTARDGILLGLCAFATVMLFIWDLLL